MSDKNSDDVQSLVTDDFKKKVKTWLTIDDQIREYRAKTKELTNEKKEYEQSILSFLEQVGEKELDVHDGKLRRNVSKTKAPLKKETIQQALSEIVKDKTKAETMTDYIINSRKVVERINLKRTKNRGPRKPKE